MSMENMNGFDIETLPGWEKSYLFGKVAELAEKYFENPENQRRFEEWLKEKKKEGEFEIVSH